MSARISNEDYFKINSPSPNRTIDISGRVNQTVISTLAEENLEKYDYTSSSSSGRSLEKLRILPRSYACCLGSLFSFCVSVWLFTTMPDDDAVAYIPPVSMLTVGVGLSILTCVCCCKEIPCNDS